MRIHIL